MERKFNKQPKLKIKKDDYVKIVAGDDRGKEGRVIEVNLDTRRVLVEGVNIVKKHLKPQVNRDYPNGGIIEKEMPINVSNVMFLEDKKPVRLGRKVNTEGKLQRYSKKSGEFIK
jgi:large subunit ribosomal protein L24